MQNTKRIAVCVALFMGGASARADLLLAVDYDSGDLFSVSTTNAVLSLVAHTGVAHLGALEFAPDGQLYGFTTGATAALFRINPVSGSTVMVGALGRFVYEGGLAFAPDGTAYGVSPGNSDHPQLFTINLATGATTLGPLMSNPPHDISGLAWRSDGMLIGLDDDTNALVTINPTTGATTQLGALNTAVGAVGGMASNGSSGYLATGGPLAPYPGSNQLYSFDLFTGASSLIGTFAPPPVESGIGGLALLIPAPGAAALGLLGLPMIPLRRREARK